MTMLDSEQSRMINDAVKGLIDSAGNFLGVYTWPDLSLTLLTGVQGSNYGYTSGGFGSIATPPAPVNYLNFFDKFPFPSDANATSVGDLTTANGLLNTGGSSSSTHGYNAGGFGGPLVGPGLLGSVNIIDKFPFATDADATDVANLTAPKSIGTGHTSGPSGYVSGGYSNPLSVYVDTIEKFPFATDADATDIGTLTVPGTHIAGQDSLISGYNSGRANPTQNITIDKFPFASDTDATSVGNLSVARYGAAGQNSTESGYASGGWQGSASNVIDKFPFSSDTNATDIANLSVARYLIGAGHSSTVSGYSAGGTVPSYQNVIDKFPFASDNNATDVGNLVGFRMRTAGQQY